MATNNNDIINSFKSAHKELLQSLVDENYAKTQVLIDKQKSLVDNFFIHMKKKCNIPLSEKEKSA